jgi:hypothetical protein
MHKILLLTFLAFSVSSFASYAKTDPEMMESQKCSNIFSYFEKRHQIPQDTLYSISLRETQKAHSKHRIGITWPWTITVNPSGKGHHFKNKTEAIMFAKEQLQSGKGSIDVGCMQINLKYHPDSFASVEQALSPQNNVEYGAKFLKEKYEQHGDWQKAIGAYHSSSSDKAYIYHAMVKEIKDSMAIYKKQLANLANCEYKATKVATTAEKPEQRPKFLGIKKVQVRVGALKENNWFRKVQ